MSESTETIFVIRDHPTWQGLSWNVSWPNRGIVRKRDHIRTMWTEAFETGAYSVGFAVGQGRCFRVDCVVYETAGDSALAHFLQHEITQLEGVSFAYRDEAERFVTAMEKIIMWKTLQRKQQCHCNSA